MDVSGQKPASRRAAPPSPSGGQARRVPFNVDLCPLETLASLLTQLSRSESSADVLLLSLCHDGPVNMPRAPGAEGAIHRRSGHARPAHDRPRPQAVRHLG
jgi:hypothetical protein